MHVVVLQMVKFFRLSHPMFCFSFLMKRYIKLLRSCSGRQTAAASHAPKMFFHEF